MRRSARRASSRPLSRWPTASPTARSSPSRRSRCSLLPRKQAMSQIELSGPDLDGVVADANAVGLPYVVIGGFSVIAHGYLRATRDSNLLVPNGPDADEAILDFFQRVEATRLHDGKSLSGEEVKAAEHLRVNAVTASSMSCAAVFPHSTTKRSLPRRSKSTSGGSRVGSRLSEAWSGSSGWQVGARTASIWRNYRSCTASCRSTRSPASISRSRPLFAALTRAAHGASAAVFTLSG